MRSALSENLLTLCPVIEQEASVAHILPIFLHLLKDEAPEVRLNLLKRLDDLKQVVNIEQLEAYLVPSLEDLAQEKSWRTKTQVIE